MRTYLWAWAWPAARAAVPALRNGGLSEPSGWRTPCESPKQHPNMGKTNRNQFQIATYLNLVASWRPQYYIVGYLGSWRRGYAQCQRIAAGLGAALAHEECAGALALQHLDGDVTRDARLIPAGIL